MKYTARYAHLSIVSVAVGQLLKEGDSIGRMGSTGQSTGAHLHIDCVRGRQDKIYTQAEIEAGKFVSDVKQLNHFIDKSLFGVDPEITTYYCEPDYARVFGKLHYGYDLIPSKGVGNIFWNRSKIGSVSAVFENHSAYGNCVYVTFEA